VIGFKDGLEGLLPPSQYIILDRERTAGIMQQGGTILGTMVSYQNYEIHDVPIAHAVHRLRLVDPNNQLVQTARAVDIYFGD
jgi:6-phosphofructokinase